MSQQQFNELVSKLNAIQEAAEQQLGSEMSKIDFEDICIPLGFVLRKIQNL